MGKGKECSCDCKEETTMASSLAHDEMPVEGIHYNGPIATLGHASLSSLNGLKYDADYHPIKTSKISDIVIKEVDYGYIVKIGCQTLAIETQTKLNRWLQEYIADPDKITKRWNDGYYHFAKVQETRIGVIAKSLEDFFIWGEQFPSKTRSDDNIKLFVIHVVDENMEHGNIIYHCLNTKTDCVGMALDKIVETNCARENRDFTKILKDSQICLMR